MKKLLLIALCLTSCKELLVELKKRTDKENLTVPINEPSTKLPTPIPIVTPTWTIGTPPTINKRCAPQAPEVQCTTAKFGDGKGGTLFKRSETNPKNYAFLLPGNIQIYKSVEVCSKKKCDKLPFVGCANPDSIGERAHHKGPLQLLPDRKWLVKFGECKLRIQNNERSD